MTISVWRYSHFALAVSSFLFMALAAVTGIILAFEPVATSIPSYKSPQFEQVTLAQAIPVLQRSFTEITDLKVDDHDFVLVKGIDSAGNAVEAYVDPVTGQILGKPAKQSAFFEWVTALHRSLFLHDTGRFIIGVTAFLLMLITVSGIALVIQRQRGLKRFFTRIVKDHFAQYYHVLLGRLSLVPILLIALTGTWMFGVRFGLFQEGRVEHNTANLEIHSAPAVQLSAMPLLQSTRLADVESIGFPFSPDAEDYFTLKLKDREILFNQVTGEVLSEVRYSQTALLSRWSMDWHTGRVSNIWAVILAIAAANILFFIYSGFVISIRRLSGRTKNKYDADKARFVILVGSENGSTRSFAKALHEQLLSAGEVSYLTDLNNYRSFPKAEQLLVLTSTHGLGDAPSNANRFLSLLKRYPQDHPVNYAVVGFGSHAYPDFCQFAYEADNALIRQAWATPLLEIHTVTDRSPEDYNTWLMLWSQQTGLKGIMLPERFSRKPGNLERWEVVAKTNPTHGDEPFLLTLKPSWRSRFVSGDLLAIYPANDYRERQYSIGKVNGSIQLCVKLHPQGLGSNYLYQLQAGHTLEGRIVSNPHFQFPAKASKVIMVSNGTGIAPFMGMIEENSRKVPTHLFCGFRYAASFTPFRDAIEKNTQVQQLQSCRIAYSREGDKLYVRDLLMRAADLVAATLAEKGVIMLCGSLSMQHDVIEWLEQLCQERNLHPVSYYQSHDQLLMDCY